VLPEDTLADLGRIARELGIAPLARA
jgi:hypothetical protein